MLIIFPPLATKIKIVVLYHHAETNDIFLHGDRVGPSPFSKMNHVEICLLESFIVQIGVKEHMYWEQRVTEIFYAIKYILLICCRR